VNGEHRILLTVDDQALAAAIKHELRRALPTAEIATAGDRASFEAAITQCLPELVVCAGRLQAFDALEVIALLRRSDLALPVVVVSGPVGEEVAAAYMKAGAADFLLTESIPRVGQVVLAVLAGGPVAGGQETPSSEVRPAEEQSGTGEQVFRRIFKSNPVAMLVVDPDTETVLEANTALAELYGTTRDRIVGAPYDRLTGDGDRGLEPALYGVAPGVRVVTPADHRRADGSLLDLEVAAIPIDFHGTQAMLCAVRRAEEPAASPELPVPPAVASDLVKGFVAEVGALLNHMRGYSDELIVQIAALNGDPVGARELGDQIGRGDLLLRQLRVLDGQEVPIPELFDLNEMVATADVVLAPVLRPEIALHLEPGTGEVSLFADRSRVEMALACLVASSVNAMPDGGRVVVRSGALSGTLAWFAVEDEGVPIHQDSLPLLFEPFQEESLLGRRTGLELAAFKRVVDELGGQAEVSGGAYRGMSVLVMLPRAS
jgi:PAS domain S-box-containing protein